MTTNISLVQDPAWVGDAPIPRPEQRDDLGRGMYPRMLKLQEDDERRLKDYLDEEIFAARIEKQQLIDDWTIWQGQYWATPEQKVKNFPFRKAANIVVPMTAIAVEAIHARLMNTVFGVKPFWSIRPKSDAWIDGAKPFEEFLDAEVDNEDSLSIFEFCQQTLSELVKLGTCVGKSSYEKITKKSIRTLSDGTEEDNFQVIRNGATLEYVPLANFLLRVNETDPQSAGWVGEEHDFTWAQLKRMSGDGRITPESVEKIKSHWLNSRESEVGDSSKYHRALDKLAKTEPKWFTIFKVQEVWMGFDIDGDGWDEEIVVDFHHETGEILSVRANWYEDLHRPYRISQYIKVEGRWPGIGVGKQNEQFQTEITTIHRQRLDNGTLANMRMIAIKKTSGYGPDEPIFPGKMWFLDDTNDISPVQLSELYPSGFGNEEATLRYSEMRTGVNEVLVGLPKQGTPGTATDTLARIEEGSKRFTLVLKNVRRWLGLHGLDVASNYQQFGTDGRHFLILGDQGQWVEKILNLPQQLIRIGAAVELTASDSIVNRQVEQQQWLTLTTVMGQYYDRAMNHASVMVQLGLDPQIVLQLAQSALQASDEITRRLLETFNVQGIDRMLLTSQKRLPDATGQAPNGEGAAGAVGGNPPTQVQPGVGGVGQGGGAGQTGSVPPTLGVVQ